MQYGKAIYMTGIFCRLLEFFSCFLFISCEKIHFALRDFELTSTSQEYNISINQQADIE